MEPWQVELQRAAREARADFQILDNVTDPAHGITATAILRAYGWDAAAHIYAEPRTPDRPSWRNARPTDIFTLAPSLGALLIEVKSWHIDSITSIQAGNFHRYSGGIATIDNPWQQAQHALSDIQNATRAIIRRQGLQEQDCPFFECIVALPFISRAEWTSKQFHRSIRDCELLLSDDLKDPAALRKRLDTFVASKAKHRIPCSTERLAHVREALGDSHVIRSRKRQKSRRASIPDKLVIRSTKLSWR